MAKTIKNGRQLVMQVIKFIRMNFNKEQNRNNGLKKD